MIARLHGVSRRPGTAEQAIDQNARAAPLVPIHHHT
jgi:hypothetical protein